MANIKRYLLLDKDDITRVCGVITGKELRKEMSASQLDKMITFGKPYKGKYILVEAEFKDDKDDIEDIKFFETKERIYYASRNGEFFSINKKSGKRRTLNKYLRRDKATIKIKTKEHAAKNLIAKLFLGAKNRDNVELKNNDPFDCSVENLIITPLREYRSMAMTARAKPVGMFKRGRMVKKWNSAMDCAKELNYSKRTIYDFIHGVRKNPIYDIRYIEEKGNI